MGEPCGSPCANLFVLDGAVFIKLMGVSDEQLSAAVFAGVLGVFKRLMPAGKDNGHAQELVAYSAPAANVGSVG